MQVNLHFTTLQIIQILSNTWTSFNFCYGLNVCFPFKFMCWNSNPQCDGIRRWGLWEVIRFRWGNRMGSPQWVTLLNGRDQRACFLRPPTPTPMWGYSKKTVSKMPGIVLTKNLIWLAPWSRTSSFQNCKDINIHCLCVWYFVTTAQTKTTSIFLAIIAIYFSCICIPQKTLS